MANNPNLRVMQIPPTTTISAHVAASNPHPQYLLTSNLLNEVKVQVSLDDLNNVDMEDAPTAKSVLVHEGDSWSPVKIGDLVSDIHFVQATTSSFGVTQLAVYNDIIECVSTTVITPDLLSKYVSNNNEDLKEYIDGSIAANQANIGYATTTSAGVVRLAVPADVSIVNNSNVVTGTLLYQQLVKKQDKLIPGSYIDANALTSSVVEVTGVQPKLEAGVGIDAPLLNGYSVVEVKNIPQNRVTDLVKDLAAKQPMLEEHGVYTSVVTTIDDTQNPPLTRYKVDVVEPLASLPNDLNELTSAFHEHEITQDAHSDLFAALAASTALSNGSFVVTGEKSGYVLIPLTDKYDFVVQWGAIDKTEFTSDLGLTVTADFTYPLHYVISVLFEPRITTQHIVLDQTSTNSTFNRFIDPNDNVDEDEETSTSTNTNENVQVDQNDEEDDSELEAKETDEVIENNIVSFTCTGSVAYNSSKPTIDVGTSWISFGIASNMDFAGNTLFVAWMPPTDIDFTSATKGYAYRKIYQIGTPDYQVIPIIAVESERWDNQYGGDYFLTITDVLDGSFSCNLNNMESLNSYPTIRSGWSLLGKMRTEDTFISADIEKRDMIVGGNYFYNYLPITLNHGSITKDRETKSTYIKLKITATKTLVIQTGVIDIAGTSGSASTAQKSKYLLELPVKLDDILHVDLTVRAYSTSAKLVNETERRAHWTYTVREYTIPKATEDNLNPAEEEGQICAIGITSLAFKNFGGDGYFYNKRHMVQWIVYGIINEQNDIDYVVTNDPIRIKGTDYYVYDTDTKEYVSYAQGSLDRTDKRKYYVKNFIHGTIYDEANKFLSIPVSDKYRFNLNWGSMVYRFKKNDPQPTQASDLISLSAIEAQTNHIYRYYIKFDTRICHTVTNENISAGRIIKCGMTQVMWKETCKDGNTFREIHPYYVKGYRSEGGSLTLALPNAATTARMYYSADFVITNDTTRKKNTNYYIKDGDNYTLYTGTLVSGVTYYKEDTFIRDRKDLKITDVEKQYYTYDPHLSRVNWMLTVTSDTTRVAGKSYYIKANELDYNLYPSKLNKNGVEQNTLKSGTTYYELVENPVIPEFSEVCVVHNNYSPEGKENGSTYVTDLSWMMIVAADREWKDPNPNAIMITINPGVSEYNRTLASWNVDHPDTTSNNYFDNMWYYATNSYKKIKYVADSATTRPGSWTDSSSVTHNVTYIGNIDENKSSQEDEIIPTGTNLTTLNLGTDVANPESGNYCNYTTKLPGIRISVETDSTLWDDSDDAAKNSPMSVNYTAWLIRRNRDEEKLHPEGYYKVPDGAYIHMLGKDSDGNTRSAMIYFDSDTKLKVIRTKENVTVQGNTQEVIKERVRIENLHFLSKNVLSSLLPEDTTNEPPSNEVFTYQEDSNDYVLLFTQALNGDSMVFRIEAFVVKDSDGKYTDRIEILAAPSVCGYYHNTSYCETIASNPATHVVETTDTSKMPNKDYYIKNSNGTYTLYTGASFETGVTYYEYLEGFIPFCYEEVSKEEKLYQQN